MVRERLFLAACSLFLAVLAIVLWWDYLSHSAEIYDARDAAQVQIREIDQELGAAEDAERFAQLTNDRTAEEVLYLRANRRINDMDGWNSLEWKVKNTLRLAAPAAAVLFAAMTLLSVLHPMKD